MLSATGPNCKLQFAYRHTGPSSPSTPPSKFSVILHKQEPTVVWVKPLRDMNQMMTTGWNSFEVHLGQLAAGYQIQFVGMAGMTAWLNPYIDMELDEIKFVNCDASATSTNTTANLTCDFETGTCGWYDYNLGSSNKIDWVSIIQKHLIAWKFLVFQPIRKQDDIYEEHQRVSRG